MPFSGRILHIYEKNQTAYRIKVRGPQICRARARVCSVASTGFIIFFVCRSSSRWTRLRSSRTWCSTSSAPTSRLTLGSGSAGTNQIRQQLYAGKFLLVALDRRSKNKNNEQLYKWIIKKWYYIMNDMKETDMDEKSYIFMFSNSLQFLCRIKNLKFLNVFVFFYERIPTT